MADPILPKEAAPVTDGAMRPTREWYNFFRDLLDVASGQTSDSSAIAELQAAVAQLQEEGADLGQIFGDMSVSVLGQLGEAVQVRLQGDETNPDTTAYYGTDAAGDKGWHLLEEAFEVEAGELTKTVDADNVTTFGLADVTPASGGSFLLTTFDAKGRRSEEVAGDAADVPFDDTGNTYVTGADVQAALDAADAGLVDAFTDLAPLADPAFTGAVGLPSYTVATLPSASPAGRMIYVTDESGGAIPAFSDGTDFRRVTDRAIVT